jgi:signal transduction histidine kinase
VAERLTFQKSLTFKIGAIIILVEIIVLTVTGYFYIRRFATEIDERVRSRVELPGLLIAQGLLNFGSIADKAVMTELVREELVDGMVVGADKRVLNSLNPAYVRQDTSSISGLDPNWFRDDLSEGLVEKTPDGLVSVTPIRGFAAEETSFFIYVKVTTNQAENQKQAVIDLFIFGSIFSVALTSIAIIWLFRRLILIRIRTALKTLRRVEAGDLSARIAGPIRADEIGLLKDGINSMATQLQETIRTLEQNLLELKEATAALQESQTHSQTLIAELGTKNAELERFTYTVSHDLKSPLITIRGFLGLLQKDATAGDAARLESDVKHIRDATEKMKHLLDDLLELSRVGRLINPPEAVSLAELAEEARVLVGGQIAERGAQINIAPNLPIVFGDRPRLLEVLQNLIDNAVKYLGHQPEPRIDIGAREAGGETIIYVHDNGIGIEPQYHEKVFGLFERLEQDTEGTGIGLALVKRIVELHGGRIWVESNGGGQGSTFCFTLEQNGQSS